MDIVGLPPTPVPFATSIWFEVPVIVDDVMFPEVDSVTKPLKLALARASTWPVKDSVGLPDTPLPLLTDNPVVPLTIERLVNVVASVLT
jgi:hypothetical protein